MAHFNISLNDLASGDSFTRSISRNMRTRLGPPRTSASIRGNPNTGSVSYSLSDIMQGAALNVSKGAVYDRFNQSLSSDVGSLLEAHGGAEEVLGGRQTLLPHDVLTKAGYHDGRIGGSGSGSTDASTDPAAATATAGPATGNIVDVGGGIQVDESIADNVRAMIAAAARDGVTLTGSGWRSNARQIQLRTINGCPDVWTASPSSCRVPTAIPGTSMHEQGLAIDFENCGSHGTAVFIWLSAHAGQYGLQNLPSESWHWSTNGR